MSAETIQILDYRPQFAPYFERFNRAWLEQYFRVEDIDARVLGNPETYILAPGGCILFAAADTRIIGTVALKKVDEGIYEMTKMAVDGKYRGMGAGKILCAAALQRAAEMKAHKVILYSNTLLANAIGIYRKLGFREIPLEKGLYERADIMMEYLIPH